MEPESRANFCVMTLTLFENSMKAPMLKHQPFSLNITVIQYDCLTVTAVIAITQKGCQQRCVNLPKAGENIPAKLAARVSVP